MLGEKAIVSSEISIQEELEDLMFLSDQMSVIFEAVIGLLALGLLARSTATAISERRWDLAILMVWAEHDSKLSIIYHLKPQSCSELDDFWVTCSLV